MAMVTESKGYQEASYVGFGFGTFLGGAVVGMAADILALPVHTMGAYVIGALLGGVAGLLAGRIAATLLL